MSKKTEKILGFIEKDTKNYNFSSWRDDSMIHLDVGFTTLKMPFKEFEELFEFMIDTRSKHYNYFKKLAEKGIEIGPIDTNTTIFEDLAANQMEEDALKSGESNSTNREEFDLEKMILGDDDIEELVIE